MTWYSWSYFTLLKDEKHILMLLNTLKNTSFTKTNGENFSRILLPTDFLRSLISLAININKD